jgi:hypothetical protein
MLKKTMGCVLLAGAALLGAAVPVAAQQTVNFNIGGFTPAGPDSRTGADCLNACTTNVDVLTADRRFLRFNISDFNSATLGGEWLGALGQFVEAGAGIGFSQRTVPSVYANYEYPSGAEIEQRLRLRLIPVDFTIRLLPLGQRSPIQPYVGGGLSVVNWHYRETGEYIDFNTSARTIYCAGPETGCSAIAVANGVVDPYIGKGTETGPVVLGGLRFAGDTFSAGGEVRYRKATGALGDDFDGVADKIDLGGWTYQATIGVRFGR